MKKKCFRPGNYLAVLLLLFIFLSGTSCSNDNDFDEKEQEQQEEGEVSKNAVPFIEITTQSTIKDGP